MEKAKKRKISKRNAAFAGIVLGSAVLSSLCSSWFMAASRKQTGPSADHYLCGAAQEVGLSADDSTREYQEADGSEDACQTSLATIPSLEVPFPNLNLARFTESHYFKRDYFRCLSGNLPINNVNNCGYVSIAALLSYYAYYWNASVLPSQYLQRSRTALDSASDDDFDSPCATDEYIGFPYGTAVTYGRESDRYRSLYDSYYSDKMGQLDRSFIAYLYKLAVDEGIWDRAITPDPSLIIPQVGNIMEILFSRLSIANRVTVVKKDINSYEGNTADEKRSSMYEEMASLLCAGKPLIIGGRLRPKDSDGNYVFGQLEDEVVEELSGHITVAYDYCEESGDIYGHSGYRSNTFENFTEMYYMMDDFCYLEFHGMPHAHNGQFEIGGQSVCSCALDSHRHSYTIYSVGNDDYHSKQCMCGLTVNENHTKVRMGLLGQMCTVCRQSFPSSSIWR